LPSRAAAEAALAILQDLLTEFSVAGEVDRAATLTALVTSAIRQSLPHAPMFHVRGHRVGSGESCLSELITALSTPQRGTPTTFPGGDEERRKLLLAELLRSPAVIEYMNRRCITILLSPQCEVPATRTFMRPHRVHEVLAERSWYLSAALTKVRAWIVAGRRQRARGWLASTSGLSCAGGHCFGWSCPTRWSRCSR
jgi:hypothetical protein